MTAKSWEHEARAGLALAAAVDAGDCEAVGSAQRTMEAARAGRTEALEQALEWVMAHEGLGDAARFADGCRWYWAARPGGGAQEAAWAARCQVLRMVLRTRGPHGEQPPAAR